MGRQIFLADDESDSEKFNSFAKTLTVNFSNFKDNYNINKFNRYQKWEL